MSTQKRSTPLEDMHDPVQAKLAAACTSFMFLYVYVDILGLYKPGAIDDILAGVAWEFEISQTWATRALTLMTIPILMVLLSTTLPARVNRATNLVVASVYVPVSTFSAVGESWTYYYGFAVALEVIVLAVILGSAWRWPCTATHRQIIPSRRSDRTTVADLQPASGPRQGPTR